MVDFKKILPLALVGIAVLFLALFFLLQPKQTDFTVKVVDAKGAPVDGAEVQLSLDGGKALTQSTSTGGKVVFRGLQQGARGFAKASAKGFVEKSIGVEIESGAEARISLEKLAAKPFSVFVRSAYGDLEGAFVKLTFDDGASLESSTNSFGSADFSLRGQQGHVTVYASKSGYLDFVQGIELPLESYDVTLSESGSGDTATEDSFGTVFVTTFLGGGSINSLVSLTRTSGDLLGEQLTQGSTASFDSVPIGAEFTVSARTEDGSAYYQGTEGLSLKKRGEKKRVIVYLQKAEPANYSVSVKAATGLGGSLEPVEGAVVSVFKGDDSQLMKRETGSNGLAAFSLPKASYYALVSKPSFLDQRVEGLSENGVDEVILVPQTDFNTARVLVKSYLEDGNPAQNALVSLKLEDGSALSADQVAGIDGTALFNVSARVKKKVYAFASLGSAFGTGFPFELKANSQTEVKLVAPKASLFVNATDFFTGQSLSAKVQAISNATLLAECTTPCTLKLPEKAFALNAFATGYLNYRSSETTLKAGESSSQSIALVPSSSQGQLSASFLGAFYNGENKTALLSPKAYSLKFLLSGNQLDEAGLYVRVGGTKCFAGDEKAVITQIPANASPVVRQGSTYPQGCSSQQSNYLKWAHFYYPQGINDSKEIAVTVFVYNSTSGDRVFVEYLAHGKKKGSYLQDPSDFSATSFDPLSPSNSTKKVSIPVQAGSVECVNGVCARIWFNYNGKDSDSPDVPANESFTNYFDFTSQTALAQFAANSTNIMINNSSVSAATNASSVSIPLNSSLSWNSTLSLSGFVEGFAFLEYLFSSQSVSAYFMRNLYLSGNKTMLYSISPSPLRSNTVGNASVRLFDDQGAFVQNAFVQLSDCDGTPLNGQVLSRQGDGTGASANGEYKFALTIASTGKIRLFARAQGFKSIDACVPVEKGSFLSSNPLNLSFTGNSAAGIVQNIVVSTSLQTALNANALVQCPSGRALATVLPNEFTLAGQAQLQVKVEKVEATENCTLRVNASLAPLSDYLDVPLYITVTNTGSGTPSPSGGTPSPNATGTPSVSPDLLIKKIEDIPDPIVMAIEKNTRKGTFFLGADFEKQIGSCGSQVSGSTSATAECDQSRVKIDVQFPASLSDQRIESTEGSFSIFYAESPGSPRAIKLKFKVVEFTSPYCINIQPGIRLSPQDNAKLAAEASAVSVRVYFEDANNQGWISDVYSAASSNGLLVIPRLGGSNNGDEMGALAVKFIDFVKSQGHPIKVIQIWNEPNRKDEWKGNPNPKDFAAQFKKVYAAIKAKHKDVQVILPPMSPCTGGVPGYMRGEGSDGFLAQLYREGIKGYYDLLGVNPYEGNNACMKLTSLVNDYWSVMRQVGGEDKQMWFSEFGFSPDSGLSHEQMAQRIPGLFQSLDALKAGGKKIGAACYWIISGNSQWDSQDMVDSNLNKRPTFNAYKQYASTNKQ